MLFLKCTSSWNVGASGRRGEGDHVLIFMNTYPCTIFSLNIVAPQCPVDIKLVGNDVITQGQFGTFVCTINEFGVLWTFGNESLEFIGTRLAGEVEPPVPRSDTNTFARLLRRNITDTSTNRGVRTSVLYFEPALDFTGSIDISCQGIAPKTNLCTKTVLVGECFYSYMLACQLRTGAEEEFWCPPSL